MLEDIKISNIKIYYLYTENNDSCIELKKKLDYYMNENSNLAEYVPLNVENIDNETKKEINKLYKIKYVPSILITKDNKLIKKIIGFYPDVLDYNLNNIKNNNLELIPDLMLENEIENHIINIIKSNGLLLFIKGTPKEPKCKFTRELLEIVNANFDNYNTINILEPYKVENMEINLRDNMKLFLNWDTFPIIFLKSGFIGGLDLFKKIYSK